MTKQKQPSEPTNTTTCNCEAVIFDVQRTILKISPHCWERNEEFKVSKKKKVKENLNKWLLDAEVIKDFVQQIVAKKSWSEGANINWPAWKYYGYEPAIDKRNDMAYRIIFFLDDNNPEIIGVITVYPCE